MNNSGNPSMAKGGSGDVLSGILGGMLAQKKLSDGKPLAYIAACGVYLHGRAGDRSAEKLGQYSPIAGDIAAAIPEIIAKRS